MLSPIAYTGMVDCEPWKGLDGRRGHAREVIDLTCVPHE